MRTSDFTFDLPKELIAQDPLEDRSSSRLMVLDKNTGQIEHRIFRDIKDYLKPGDCLVINDTRVIPARLIGMRENSGGKAEIFLLKRKEKDVWEIRPGGSYYTVRNDSSVAAFRIPEKEAAAFRIAALICSW